MSKVTIDLTFVCDVCDDVLKANPAASTADGKPRVSVEPCKRCLGNEGDEAYADGLKDGREEVAEKIAGEVAGK